MSRKFNPDFDPLGGDGTSRSATSCASVSAPPRHPAYPSQPSTTGGFGPQSNSNHQQLDSRQMQFLTEQGFSSGLIRTFCFGRTSVPLRIWLLDNGVAMNVRDSHRISGTFDNINNYQVTRWEELQDCIAYHSQVAAIFAQPTRFAMLNDPGNAIGPQYISVSERGPQNIESEIATLTKVMTHTRPTGPTPLTEQLVLLQQYVASIAPQLRQRNQKVSIIVATQGIPASQRQYQFVEALRSLEGFPVWVVIRLCTDDESVFEFYNSLDSQLSLPYDVLDDFFSEALEVYLRNPWLTYGLPLHRLRENGLCVPVLDVIDERALTPREVRDLCNTLFVSPYPLPDPETQWDAFFHAISSLVGNEKSQWNPVTRRVTPWINLQELNRFYGRMTGGSLPPEQHGAFQQNMRQTHPPQNPSYPQHHQQQQSWDSRQDQPTSFPSGNPPLNSRNTPNQQVPMTGNMPASSTSSTLKSQVMLHWAQQPPHQTYRAIPELLGTVHTIFPPMFGVERHEYFDKWKPLSREALASGQAAVLKRAIRKMKFFLHPDKLPSDFSESQSQLCRLIWDVIAEVEDK